ncbi:MAG: hypothetical protein HQ567_27785 [Candidatus Nealsonbacteria bacterium]|nr:hypothetical protein [Candidatus Nealsonbacteria bacterium]
MALQKREKILVIATGVAVVVLAIAWLATGGESSKVLHAKRAALVEKRDQKKAQSRLLGPLTRELARRELRSLPTEREAAEALYTKWLRETIVDSTIVDSVEFSNASISPKAGTSRPGVYTALRFGVEMNGTLDQLTQFLHEFYKASHLHKISLLSVNPTSRPSEFKLDLTIEALILPGAKEALILPGAKDDKNIRRSNKLSTERVKRLELSSLQEYQDVILSRKMEENRPAAYAAQGLFASYAPPPEPERPRVPERVPERVPDPEPPEPPAFDLAKYTYVTALVSVGGVPEAWLEIRPTGETKVVKEGEQFEIGHVRCEVVRIGNKQLEVALDGEHRLVGFRESLRDGLVMPDF